MKDVRALFEKLSDPDPGPAYRRVRQLNDSVLKNLRRILNTRHGNSPALPDYGVIDLSTILHNYPESIQDMGDSIRRCIESYEPRLRGVMVLYEKDEDDVLSLRFRISAQIVMPGARQMVNFDTLVTSSGRVKVSV